MIPVSYIAGKYRHYWPSGAFDRVLMDCEIDTEKFWAKVVADCGCMWIAPLANSVFLEGEYKQEHMPDFIRRDLEIIRRLRPGYDVILMRRGWDDEPESEGARKELDAAVAHGLHVANGALGVENVQKYLKELMERAII